VKGTVRVKARVRVRIMVRSGSGSGFGCLTNIQSGYSYGPVYYLNEHFLINDN